MVRFPFEKAVIVVVSGFPTPVFAASIPNKALIKVLLPTPAGVTMGADEVQAAVLAAPESAKWLEGKQVRKVIFVPKKIVNIVVG